MKAKENRRVNNSGKAVQKDSFHFLNIFRAEKKD